jgi:hypothetical protein
MDILGGAVFPGGLEGVDGGAIIRFIQAATVADIVNIRG